MQIVAHSGTLRGMSRTVPDQEQSANAEQAEQKPGQAGEVLFVDAAATATQLPRETGGPAGLEPTRYGDWERKGRCIDF